MLSRMDHGLRRMYGGGQGDAQKACIFKLAEELRRSGPGQMKGFGRVANVREGEEGRENEIDEDRGRQMTLTAWGKRGTTVEGLHALGEWEAEEEGEEEAENEAEAEGEAEAQCEHSQWGPAPEKDIWTSIVKDVPRGATRELGIDVLLNGNLRALLDTSLAMPLRTALAPLGHPASASLAELVPGNDSLFCTANFASVCSGPAQPCVRVSRSALLFPLGQLLLLSEREEDGVVAWYSGRQGGGGRCGGTGMVEGRGEMGKAPLLVSLREWVRSAGADLRLGLGSGMPPALCVRPASGWGRCLEDAEAAWGRMWGRRGDTGGDAVEMETEEEMRMRVARAAACVALLAGVEGCGGEVGGVMREMMKEHREAVGVLERMRG